MFCPKCGKNNPADAAFCENCGSPLSAPSPAPVPPAAAPAAPSPEAPVKKRWPVILPILFGLALMIEIYFMIDFFAFLREYSASNSSMLMIIITWCGTLLTVALALLMFILPTRKTPILTAIPRILTLSLSVLSIVTAAVNRTLDSNSVPVMAMGMIAVVFYIIDAAARPRSKVLAIFHAIFCGMSIVGSFINLSNLYSVTFGGVLDTVEAVLINVGFIIALFLMVRRPKKQKA
ncbi:MAG: zinc-ribbon domain-containing protein [Clostridia bacterium]|nr:zinc-ribbon domain-containing protein [Clostridia bacterium]